MTTKLIGTDNMTAAAEIILAGGLVAVPTETVYGLAANGLDHDAVMKIYEVKGRPETKPINLLVSGMADVESFCTDIPAAAFRLAEKFWPGPLTMILNRRDIVPNIVTAGGKTLGVRCPDNKKTLDLIKLTGVPLAAPSANPSDMPSPKSADTVAEYFDGKIDGIIDDGVCRLGIESTILDLTVSPPRILRLGGLSKEAIEDVLGVKVLG